MHTKVFDEKRIGACPGISKVTQFVDPSPFSSCDGKQLFSFSTTVKYIFRALVNEITFWAG